MRFGCCFSLWDDEIFRLKEAGADYVEPAFSALADHTLEECRARARQLREAGLTVGAMNVMFPGGYTLVGPAANIPDVVRYVKETLEKAKAFAAPKVVLGSGGARRIPEDCPKEEALRQFAALCRTEIGPAFEAQGMLCCIEPLNRDETNLINSSAEAWQLVREINHPGIRLLVDLYHFDREGEDLTVLGTYRGWLQHTHIASAKNARRIPAPGDGEDYAAFFRALRGAGYNGSVSLEGNSPGGMEEIAASLAYLRSFAG